MVRRAAWFTRDPGLAFLGTRLRCSVSSFNVGESLTPAPSFRPKYFEKRSPREIHAEVEGAGEDPRADDRAHHHWPRRHGGARANGLRHLREVSGADLRTAFGCESGHRLRRSALGPRTRRQPRPPAR